MTSEEVKEEIKKYSKENNITIEQVKEVVYYVFKFVRNIIKSADSNNIHFPSVRVMGLGIFYVSNSKKRRLQERKDRLLKKKKDEKRK